jgi:WD40 repeat protein
MSLQHLAPVVALAFSPDGKLVASAGRDSAVRVWESDGLRLRQQFYLPGVTDVAISPGSKLLAVLTETGALVAWDLTTGGFLFRQRHWRSLRGLAFSPDGTLIATGGEDKTVRLWSSEDGRQLRELRDFTGEVLSVAFSPNGRRLASAARAVTLWDVDSGKRLRSTGRDCPTDALAFAPDGKTIAAGRIDGQIILLDAGTLAEKGRFEGRREPVHVAFGPDGRTVVVAAADRSLCVFRAGKKEPVITVESPQGVGSAMALSPDGKVIANAGGANHIDLLDIDTGKRLPPVAGTEARRVLPERRGAVTAIAAGRGRVITASTDGVILASEAATGKTLFCVSRDAPRSAQLALSPDGALLAWTDGDRVRVWDALRGKELYILKGMSRPRALLVSPGGESLALAWVVEGGKGEVRLHEALTGKPLQSLRTDGPAQALAFSGDGEILSYLTQNCLLGRWSLAKGEQLGISSHYELLHPIALSPGGSLLAAPRPAEIELRNTRRKESRFVRLGQETVRALAFSPDERLLLCLDSEDSVRLYEFATGSEVMRLGGGHVGSIHSVAFLGGTRAVTGGGDSTALVWDLAVDLGGRTPGGALTEQEFTRLWRELASEDGRLAMAAVWRLASAEKAGPQMRDALNPLFGVDPAEVRQRVAELNHRRFVVRAQARARLIWLGRAAAPALSLALENGPSLEMRRRIEDLMEQLPSAEGERLRADRVVQALESAGSPEAKELLEALQTKAWSAEVRSAARLALVRIKQGN